jgi:hypothetical protein
MTVKADEVARLKNGISKAIKLFSGDSDTSFQDGMDVLFELIGKPTASQRMPTGSVELHEYAKEAAPTT